MKNSPILAIRPLGVPWDTLDPFLFCVHHVDHYPPGNEVLGPATSLQGRNIGQDFANIDGWNMYHGDTVPGFPQHPHRGFETITIARRGFIDHSDSLGATARFGQGDVQWMTAGRGIVHCEMFPLLSRNHDNPAELFQIWLNLPHQHKLVDPHFSMLWSHTVPQVSFSDDKGRATQLTIVAGKLGTQAPPPSPPKSWAANVENDVAVWCIKMAAHAEWTLPKTVATTNRMLYFFSGESAEISSEVVQPKVGLHLKPDADIILRAGSTESEFLLLQGRPIGEPVVQYGPFVMNSPAEIRQAFVDYQTTQFGGWPWPVSGPVHAREQKRFAIHADGRKEEITGQ